MATQSPALPAEVVDLMALAEVLAHELILMHRLLRLSGRMPQTMDGIDMITLGVRDMRKLVAGQAHRPASALTK